MKKSLIPPLSELGFDRDLVSIRLDCNPIKGR